MIDERLEALVGNPDPERIRAVGEDLRAEAEESARHDPTRLPPLYEILAEAAELEPRFRPWALWIEGSTQHLCGYTGRAVELLEEASRLFRGGKDDHAAARVDLAGMDALACCGRHRLAESRGRRALLVFEENRDTRRVVSALLNLGGIKEARGQINRAIEFWERARRIVPAEDDLRRGLLAVSLGSGYQCLGRFHDAQTEYASAARHLDAAEAHSTRRLAVLGRAEIEALRGDLGGALPMIVECESEADRAGDDNVLAEARLLKCRVELMIGHPQRSEALAKLMHRRCQRNGRPDDSARFLALRAMAASRTGTGSRDLEARAENALGEAIGASEAAVFRVEMAIRRGAGDVERLVKDAALLTRAGHRVMAAQARAAAAEVARCSADDASARRLARNVLDDRCASASSRVLAHRVLSRLEEGAQPVGALRHLRRAITIRESVRGRLSSERDRACFAAQYAGDCERLVLLLLARGDRRSRREAFEIVARFKSRSLVEAIDRRVDLEWQTQPDLAERWNRLRGELTAMLSTLEGWDGGEGRYCESAVESRVRRVAKELETVEIELGRCVPSISDALELVTPPGLRSQLQPGEMVIETFFAAEDLVVFTLRRNGLTVEVRRGARRLCTKLVEELRFLLSRAEYGRRFLESPAATLVRSVRSRLGELGRLLFSHLEGRPRPARIWVAPHGELHHVPMAALEVEGLPVVAHCPISVIPSSSVLARLLARPRRRPDRLAIAGAGGDRLPEIGREIQEISSRFEEAEVVETATVADVQRLLERSDAMHIASHGAFQPLAPRGSGLLLSDGWFTALDVLRTGVNVDLITCAACSSGNVQVDGMGETSGVVRALFAAGVSTALLAPGVLDDRLSRTAAGLFYDAVFEVGPGEAFRRTLLQLHQEYAHPALWASLQLYGDARPWEDE